jgi:hypothetical protein
MHIAYTNNFTSKLIQIKGTVLTFAPVEKLERGPCGPFWAETGIRQEAAPTPCRAACNWRQGEEMARQSNNDGDAGQSRFRCAGLLLTGLLGMFSNVANAAWELNLQMPVTALARRVYDLHTLLTWVIFIIFVGVFARSLPGPSSFIASPGATRRPIFTTTRQWKSPGPSCRR